MLMSAFVNDDGEPVAGVKEELEAVIKPEDCEPIDPKSEGRALAELLADFSLEVHEIHAVSENVATIALHALHGVLQATEIPCAEDASDSAKLAAIGAAVDAARAWALAGVRELAFYDVDGLETDVDDDGMPVAVDPGRDAASKVFTGAHGVPYVEWPA
jgi:hypothetical protein